MTQSIAGFLAVVAGLFVIFRALEWTRPKQSRLPILRRGFWTDMTYLAFTPIVTKAVTRFAIILVAIPIAYIVWSRVDGDLIKHGFGPLSKLPYWVQAFGILFLGDLVGYWMHRAFHRGRLWRFHAVHHASIDLDWLSSVRVHPVNDAIMKMASALPTLALGFAPVALAAVTPIFGILAVLVHANVTWDWGPLRWVFASPRFHRWHHTDEAAARDKNFAGLFPIFDIVFGTYYMPRDKVPTVFGTSTPVPEGLWQQLKFPFRQS